MLSNSKEKMGHEIKLLAFTCNDSINMFLPSLTRTYYFERYNR